MAEPGLETIFGMTGVARPFFVVNVAVTDVIIQNAAAPYMAGPDGAGFMTHQDNFELVSVGFRLPYCFTLGDNNAMQTGVNFSMIDPTLANTHLFPELGFGGASMLEVPLADVEIPYNLRLAYPASAADFATAQFEWTFTNTYVSMINAPAALDTETIFVYPFIKVRHTLIRSV